MNVKALQRIVDASNSAYLIYNQQSREIIMQNKAAISLFGKDCKKTPIVDLFGMRFDELMQAVLLKLEEEEVCNAWDVPIFDHRGEKILCDLQAGYLNEEQTQLFLKMKHKFDEKIEQLKELMSMAPVPFFVLDNSKEMAICYANQKFYQTIGLTEEVIREKYTNSFASMILAFESTITAKEVYQRLEESVKYKLDLGVKSDDGTTRWFCFDINQVEALNHNHKFYGMLFSIESHVEEVERLNKVQNELYHRATYDALTKVLNRASFEEEVKSIIETSASHVCHALYFIDLDDFKHINDTYGHAFGDFLLAQFAARLKNRVKEGDLIGRIGGDEFVIFMKNIEDIETIQLRANSILEDLVEEFTDGLKGCVVQVSIGIARFRLDATTYEELIKCADAALYYAKNHGKNIAVIYKKDI